MLTQELLSKEELEHDLNVLINEYKLAKDCWSQFPAKSYGNNIEGCINLRNLVNLAIAKIAEEGS